ncbi:MAG: hypothetical protein LBU34_13860, partial [Planctomycetaceae bacterium]|nr:hypothetical protein [Planctomycetaceae bacterium]
SQTILVKNLQQKYEGYLAEISSQTIPLLVDTQFQQDQLRRINAIIEQLELRVLTLQSNRYAPPQIELKRKAQAHITTRCGLF